MPTAAASMNSPHLSNGARLVTADGRTLPLAGVALAADAKGGVARVKLTMRFSNPFAEPLKVTYQVPLPANAAVSGFSFTIGELKVVGEVDAKQKARQRFEEALLEGRTAALLDQERTSLFTQEVGNIPPGEEVVCELELDQVLSWLPEGAWEFRFPTVVAPRYQGAQGRVRDAAQVTVDVADAPLGVQAHLALSIRDALPQGARPESPSHQLFSQAGLQRFDVTFAGEAGAALDRDVVVRWKAAQLQVGASLDLGRPRAGAAAYGLITLVPPEAKARVEVMPRDLIVLLDTSGSMSGAPLDQARRIVGALVDTLGPADKLEMIEFSSSARRWKWRPQAADEKTRQAAHAWLASLRASGGTEMKDGILEALAPLRDEAQRQVVLVTDGLIGFEDEVLDAIREKLPSASRVHTVGVGSGVNRSLTRPAARVGRGVELIVSLDEDVERVAERLCARTAQPYVTSVEITGTAVDAVAPERLPDLFAGAPCLASLKLKPQGGSIIVRGRTAHGGAYEERLEVKPIEPGEGSAAIATLFGREKVEDLETSGLGKSALDRAVEQAGLEFQISTRLTSWVAITREATVDPRAPRRNQTVPHALPYGMSAEGLGLRAPSAQPVHSAAPSGAAFGVGLRARASAGGRPLAPSKAMAPPASRSEVDAEERSYESFADDGADHGEQDEATGSFAPPPRDEPAALVPAELGRAGKPDEGAAAKDKKEQAPRAPARAAPGPQRPQAPTRRLAARVVMQKDGRLYLEIQVAGAPLAWEPRAVTLKLLGGAVVAVTLVSERTTLPTTATAGMALSLALEVGELAELPVEVNVLMDGEVVTLVL